MTTKAEKQEAIESLREFLRDCGPGGKSTLLILDDGGRPSSTGRTHRLDVHVIQIIEGRPQVTMFLNYNVARALGIRQAKDECLLMGGYGYSRSCHIADHLADLVGHPLYCDSAGIFAGAHGWVGQPKKARTA